MDLIFRNSENNKTSDSYRYYSVYWIKNLKRTDKYIALSNLSICYTWKNIKNSCKNNKFKMSAQKWNDKFELAGRSCGNRVLSFNSEILYIEEWFPNQNSKLLEREDEINIALVSN